MKFFNYFKKKLNESLGEDISKVESDGITFKNGLVLSFEFSELENVLTNVNYKKEIYNAIQDIKGEYNIDEVPDPAIMVILEHLKEELKDKCRSVKFIEENDNVESLVFTSLHNERIAINFTKGQISSPEFLTDHFNTIMEHVLSFTSDE